MNRVAERPQAGPTGRPSTATENERSGASGNRTLPRMGRGVGSGVTKFERWCLKRVLERLGDPPIQIVLWNGETIATSSSEPVVTLRFGDRRTLWKVLSDPRFQFGEAYVDRRLEIEGEIFDL